jgi:hypothetical protein
LSVEGESVVLDEILMLILTDCTMTAVWGRDLWRPF